MEDTIAAISTSLGVGAISIIRISGPNSIEIVNKIVKIKNLDKVNSHTINYNFIIDGDKTIDEVLISIMKAPKTFTCEDVVEINAHGGISTTNYILKLLLKNGCRLAEPGEFTKRAFLNGRIDLQEAEGIMNLINAKTDKAHNLAINQLSGKVSNLIKELRNDIIQILANIEVNIDYPEYEDIIDLKTKDIKPKMELLLNKIEKILKDSKNGLLINEGIKTSIIGKPNVGKSSLLNRLLEEEKAIVTDIEGTTRDIVEGKISLDGIILNIIDTAGIRDTENLVESIGVKKSLELIDNSDLVLFVLNNNEELSVKEKELLEKIKEKNYIVVINKSDLDKKIKIDNDISNIVYISAKEDIGIEELKNKIKEIYNLEKIETEDMTYLSNSRSIALLEQSYDLLKEAMKNIDMDIPVDMVEIDIKEAWNKLGEITGETYQDELINQLFSQFCLGK
ncbi:MAG TPA: tRNA uridine-5-carboxymethylaminomethyl(34) synthesis GTPase MnmE [Bacilli bacterium]|nr:tRNA uridine-5-carboxymethylaminomethyl(34) synthesis GTPase MnmE [Bacilli bacterium]